MKGFGDPHNSFSAATRIRASGFVAFSSRVFLRPSGGLGVQAASGTGWERAARSHGGVEMKDPLAGFPLNYVPFNGYRPLFASNTNSLRLKDFRKTYFCKLIPEF